MSFTPNKKEKISDLITNWDKYKKLTLSEIGFKLGVSGRTIYTWKKELEKREIKLEMDKNVKSDKDLFDSFKKK